MFTVISGLLPSKKSPIKQSFIHDADDTPTSNHLHHTFLIKSEDGDIYHQ